MADQQVRTSERPFRDEVKRADPTPENKTVYVFSNGAKFNDRPDPYKS